MKVPILTLAIVAAAIHPLIATELKITRSAGQARITWPLASTNDFYLQYTTSLQPPVVWLPLPDAAAAGSDWVVTNAIAGASRFYRLQAWETLFDGTSLAAFRGYQQPGLPPSTIWTVNASGELEAVPGGVSVDLITVHQYADFELRWEWKTAALGNSGVNYRATEEYSRAEWSGPEYQLLDDPGYSVPAQNTSASVWNLIAPTNKTLLPAGQWNQCRILVQSNHVEHWLNGARVISYELNSPAFQATVAANSTFNVYPNFGKARTGHLALRHENRQVWYRHIKLRRLPPD